MTAPLKHSDPITVDVALGERGYDIIIGRDVLPSLGARVAALRPGARTAIVTDRTVAKYWLEPTEASLAAAGIATSRVVVEEGEGSKTYAGLEQAQAKSFNAGTTLLGYGNPGFSNVGCTITTPSSFAGTTPTNCIANNRRLEEITVGFWQNLYKGDYGRVAAGAEYEYIRRQAFAGLGGAPSTDDNIVMTSLRWYPF